MAPEYAQMVGELMRQVRAVGARFASPPDANDELLRLLEDADTWLSRVDQSPPKKMYNALRPTMNALIKKELLNHANPDISVVIASCLTEVTRITAPDAPYDDDVMRDVFTIVVDAFGKLDDMNSPSYAKRVAMLETVAKVRSCVLMLDLDCDDLILDTFQHFFRTVSLTHEDNVISSMETIMMFVIKESEPVHPDLAFCLLLNVKKEKKESLPASFALAERVISLCSEKLKPAFIQLLQGTPLNEYSEVVTSLVHGSSDAKDDKIDASGSDLEASKLKNNVDCSGQDRTPSVNHVKPPNGLASSKQKLKLPSDDKQPKISDESLSSDKEAAEPVNTEEIKSKKSHKLDTSSEAEGTGHPMVVSNSQGLAASGEFPSKNNDSKKTSALETCNTAADDTSKPVDGTPAVDKPKRGRPPAAKSHEKKLVGKSQGSGKESIVVCSGSTSKGRAARRLGKDDSKSPSRKTREEESSKKEPKGSLNMVKEDTDEDLSLKVLQSKKTKVRDENLVGSRIEVWWPDDKKFYVGVVKSFDGSSKKHKIVYDDGDVEELLLKNEKWEFVAEEQDNTPPGKSDTGKQNIIDDSDLPKKRGRPKGVRTSNSNANDDSPVTSPRSKVNSSEKDAEETSKTVRNLKNEGGRRSRITGKLNDDGDEAGNTKTANRSKDDSGIKRKDSRDETKSSESNPKGASTPKVSDGSKTNGLSAKRKMEEKEGESSEEQGSAKISTGKKRRRKARN